MAHTNGHHSTPKSEITFAEALALSSEHRPATAHRTSDRFQAVKLWQDANHASSKRKAFSVPDRFQQTCIEFADVVALKHQNIGEDTWQSVTYSQYHVQVLRAAKVFIKLGLEPLNGVGILANNSPEWFYSCLGTIHAGGLSAGIYTTNSPESVFHVLIDSSANIVIVDDIMQMKKIREIRHRLPNLKAVIQTQGPYEDFVDGTDGYYRWSELMAANHDDQEPELINRVANIRVNECCCLVYTSGTVGNPKGVMMSHDNIIWSAWSMLRSIPNPHPGKEVIVSYLPLSHIAAQIVDIGFGATIGVTIYFADKDALKGSLIKTLTVAQPTRFVGVPRVYEKIYEKMMSIGAKTTGIKKVLATWSKSHTLQHWLDHISGSPTETLQYKFARYMVMGQVKAALGFSRCQSIISAAAPMSTEIKRYFLSLDIPIMEAFGMSETSGAHCIGILQNYNLTSLGSGAEGQETKIINQDENGHGEILMKGRHICMGYLNEPTKTDEALDDEGFLHSGDLGYVDQADLLYITGRLKDLIITAGGENVPPSKIEHTILSELQVLSNVFLVGDKRKFLTCLVTLKTELDSQTGEPKDELLPETITWLESLGVLYTTLSEIIAAGPCPKVLTAIEDAIKRANKQSISNAQKVQKFTLLPCDFSFVGGELGPTLKVKRNVVSSKYAETIGKLYDN